VDWPEILGGLLVGIAVAIVEHLRHRQTARKYAVVVEGVEIATRVLENGKKDKASADLVKMHIRSVAVKRKLETPLNIDVKKIQAMVERIAEAKAAD